MCPFKMRTDWAPWRMCVSVCVFWLQGRTGEYGKWDPLCPKLCCASRKSPPYKPSSCRLSKLWTYVPSTLVMSGVSACSLSSIPDFYTLPLCHLPLLSLLHSVTFACSLNASHCTVWLYFWRYCTRRLKVGFLFWVLFCVCFLCIILCKNYYKPIIIQYHVASCVSWVPRLTYKQLGLMNALSEGNSCICRWPTTLNFVVKNMELTFYHRPSSWPQKSCNKCGPFSFLSVSKMLCVCSLRKWGLQDYSDFWKQKKEGRISPEEAVNCVDDTQILFAVEI